jgi:hypothetical protein
MLGSAFQPKENEGHTGFAALFQRDKKVTSAGWSLIENFQRISQHIKNLDTKSITKNNWKQEDKDLIELLQAGKKVGMEKARAVVTAQKQTRLNGLEKIAEKVLYDEETEIKGSWGEVAKKQEKALKKLARSVEK